MMCSIYKDTAYILTLVNLQYIQSADHMGAYTLQTSWWYLTIKYSAVKSTQEFMNLLKNSWRLWDIFIKNLRARQLNSQVKWADAAKLSEAIPILKSDNLQYNTQVRWADGTNN